MKCILCEYANNKSSSIRVKVECSIDNQPCGLIRWCTYQRCVKMNDFYNKNGCSKKKLKEEESK